MARRASSRRFLPLFLHVRLDDSFRGPTVFFFHDFLHSFAASQNHRVAMCERAVEDSQWVVVSDWETKQQGWTRTALVRRK